MRRILCLWLPNWAAQWRAAARREREVGPVCRTGPLGATGGLPASAASTGKQAARGTLASAREALEQLAAWCERFSPLVAVEDAEEPECLLLDVTGLAPFVVRHFSAWSSSSPRGTEVPHDESQSGEQQSGEQQLAERIQQAFAARGYEARLAIADTIGAAWAMARFGTPASLLAGEQVWKASLPKLKHEDPSRLVRPVNELPGEQARPQLLHLPPRRQGSKRNKDAPPLAPQTSSPAAQGRGGRGEFGYILPPGDTSWHALPVEALRLSAEVVSQLHKLGVQRIEQIVALPRETLTSRFGEELLRRLDQASGRVQEVVRAQRPLPDWTAAWSPETPLASRQALEHVLAALVQRLADQLARAGQGAVEVSVGHSLRECRNRLAERVGHTISLLRPTADADHLMDLIRLRLERLRLSGPVETVRVSVLETAPLTWRQAALFAENRRDDPRQLNVLVDRLSARLGRDRVLRPQLAAAAQPERAFRLVPWTSVGDSLRESPPTRGARRPQRKKTGETRSSSFQPLQRPLRLAAPRAIHVVSLAGGGPPAVFEEQEKMGSGFRVQDSGMDSSQRSAISLKSRSPSPRLVVADTKRHEVARHWGPETIQTGWWRGQSVQRDYYRVETTAGRRFWLFRRQQDGKWFVQGEFV